MIICGINPVAEALKSGRQVVERIWICKGSSNARIRTIVTMARSQGIPVRFETLDAIKRRVPASRHQRVVAQVAEVPYTDLATVLGGGPRLLLLVDGVEDPRNLGAVLRTAEATGVEAVLIPERRSSGLTSVAVKSSAGAAMHLNISRIGNVSRALASLKEQGFWVVGLDRRGTHSAEELDVGLPLVVVVGGEHRGLRPVVRKQCDFLISLPMKGQVSSLNLSVAAGVLLYQILLKRENGSASQTG